MRGGVEECSWIGRTARVGSICCKQAKIDAHLSRSLLAWMSVGGMWKDALLVKVVVGSRGESHDSSSFQENTLNRWGGWLRVFGGVSSEVSKTKSMVGGTWGGDGILGA